jgi:hypothetical protein
MASVKLFYSQRLGSFADVDPSPKMVMFVFPLIMLQIGGPVLSLVLLAAYFKALVVLYILFIILTQLIVLHHLYFKGKRNRNFEKLYQPGTRFTTLLKQNSFFLTSSCLE